MRADVPLMNADGSSMSAVTRDWCGMDDVESHALMSVTTVNFLHTLYYNVVASTVLYGGALRRAQVRNKLFHSVFAMRQNYVLELEAN